MIDRLSHIIGSLFITSAGHGQGTVGVLVILPIERDIDVRKLGTITSDCVLPSVLIE